MHRNMLTVAVLACYNADISIQLKAQLRFSTAESQKMSQNGHGYENKPFLTWVFVLCLVSWQKLAFINM